MKKIKKSGSLLFNIQSYALLQIVNMLVGLVLPRMYLAVYGSEVNGIVSTINSFITYFSYLEAGIGLTLIHALFKPLAEKDISKTNGILSFSKQQYQKISFVYFMLVLMLSLLFPLLNPSNVIGNVEFSSLVLVIGLYGALDFYTMAKYRVLLTADKKEYILSYAMIVAQVLRFIFVWILLKCNLSVVLVKVVPILTLIVRSIILKLYMKKYYSSVNFSVAPCNDTTITSKRWDALLLQISISTSTALPAIIVSQILGYKEANVYAMYALVINSVIAIVSALSSGVSPMLGQNIALGKDITKIYNTYDLLVTYILTVVFSITVVMILPFINLYTDVVNDVHYIYPQYAILICIWGALYSYRIPSTAVINAAGIYVENRIHNIVNLVLQVFVGWLFTALFGIVGLIFVMITCAFHRNVSFVYVNNKELLHGNLNKTVFRQIIMVGVIVFSYYTITPFLDIYNMSVLNWIFNAMVFSIVLIIFITLLFICFEYRCVKELAELIISKFKSN